MLILDKEKDIYKLNEIFEKISSTNAILFLGAGASVSNKIYLSKQIIDYYEDKIGKSFDIPNITKLLDVLEGNVSISTVSAQWAKEDNADLLNWQQNLVQNRLRDSFRESKEPRPDEIQARLSSLLTKDLWLLNDGLLKLKALSTHPLNAQLFAENMISLWQK